MWLGSRVHFHRVCAAAGAGQAQISLCLQTRVIQTRVNYRIIYFFHGRGVGVVSHGLVKERIVPPREIELAIQRKALFATDPDKHTYEEEKR